MERRRKKSQQFIWRILGNIEQKKWNERPTEDKMSDKEANSFLAERYIIIII